MNRKFPFGYDINTYIDKALEQMKADFPWATRDMITRNLRYGIKEVDGEYQYVYYSSTKFYIENIDSDKFIRKLSSDHDWELGEANPVKEFIDVPASDNYSGGWFLETYRIQKHELGGYSAYIQAGNRSAGGSRTFFIPASYLKLPWEEFLDKYLDLISPGPFYVGRDDLERCTGLKEFLGYN